LWLFYSIIRNQTFQLIRDFQCKQDLKGNNLKKQNIYINLKAFYTSEMWELLVSLDSIRESALKSGYLNTFSAT